MMSQKPRSCGTTFRLSSEAASRLDLHARPHAHVSVVAVVDLPQRPRRRVTDRAHFVALRQCQSVAGTRAFDLSQRPGGGCADILVAVLERGNERIHRPIILDFAESPGSQHTHFRVSVLQSGRERTDRAAVLDLPQGPDGSLSYIGNGIER